jgi:hypothetical protein
MTEEIWKDLPEYEGLYQISNLGRVYSLFLNRIIKPFRNQKGYLRLDLRGKKRTTKVVHRLVLETFTGPQPKLQVNHKNGIKDDNRLENLEWVTGQQNVDHAWRTGLSFRPIGSLHPRATVTESDVVKIREAKISREYTLAQLAKDFNTTKLAIISIRGRTTWKHVK